jgi:hypothetical protein
VACDGREVKNISGGLTSVLRVVGGLLVCCLSNIRRSRDLIFLHVQNYFLCSSDRCQRYVLWLRYFVRLSLSTKFGIHLTIFFYNKLTNSIFRSKSSSLLSPVQQKEKKKKKEDYGYVKNTKFNLIEMHRIHKLFKESSLYINVRLHLNELNFN